MTEPILNRIKNEVWVTQMEYEDWHVRESTEWEIVEKDYQRDMIKIRRIDQNDRNGTSKEV